MADADTPASHGWTVGDLRGHARADWVALAHQLRADLQYRHTTLMASGVAFRAFLALFSSLVVASSALVLAQPAGEIIWQTRRLTLGLPYSAREVLVKQVESIVLADNVELRITFAIALLLAIWASASTIQGVMDALTATHGGVEDRSWVRRRLISLALTVGALALVAAIITVITGLPVLFERLGVGDSPALAILVELVALSLMMFSGLLVIYHHGPAQPLPNWRWTWPGALLATIAWLAGTEVFAQAVEHVGTYNFRYGTVAGIVVLMLWLLLTSWCVLFGAAVNSRLARRSGNAPSPTEPILAEAIRQVETDRAVSSEAP